MLIRTGVPQAARAAAWLASELGDRATPLLDDLPTLLTNPTRYVRFFALDAVLTAATTQHGRLLAQAITLTTDPDAAVRWKATRMIAAASVPQLEAAIPHVADDNARVLIGWLAAGPTS